MLKTHSNNPLFLSVLSGILVFLAFEKFNVVPLVFLFPIFFNALAFRCPSFKSAFLWGFLTSFIIMLGGFYWVTYVIHEFGYLPWSVSALLFLGFCGFGALNFPLFLGVANWIHRRFYENPSAKHRALWFAVGLPALFTIVEFFIPKLFPWYLGHCLYKQLWLIQLPEYTGSAILTFSIYSLGSVLGAVFYNTEEERVGKSVLAFPLILIAFQIVFSLVRLQSIQPDGRRLKVNLIQANIGSLEKVESEKGIKERVQFVVDRHQKITEESLQETPNPDLILWPETAMPFQLNGPTRFAEAVRALVQKWNIPLVTGAYAQSKKRAWRDHNTAFLLLPQPDHTLKIDMYYKNVLLAFGEYLPLGDTFPKLYRMFPQVGGFDVGTEQNAFTLADGTKLGVTICYESILPAFYRKTILNGVHGVINLTNDSWFGPTSEPYLHGSLTIFRAIESRVPLLRVTNTGISFAVDSTGKLSPLTPVYAPAHLNVEMPLPKEPIFTFYMRYGDWFIALLAFLLVLSTWFLYNSKHAPVSV